MSKKKRSKGLAFIGTSGWNYDSWKKGAFYAEGIRESELLPEYAKSFRSVEVNRSFYKLPSEKAVNIWREQSPQDFIFACKASRFLTHRRKLKEPEEPIERLLRTLKPLGTKLGPLLFQLPPNWRVNLERLEYFLQQLPADHRHTIEFRDQSWLTEDVYQLLEDYGVALCFYDFKAFRSPEVVTSDFVYIRLHGPHQEPYRGSYDGRTLSRYARKMREWMEGGLDVYCYFDNDQNACAPKDAQRLVAKLNDF